jgi:hypothetical protein
MTLEEIKNCLCVGTFSNLKISWNEEASNYLNAEQTLNYDAKKEEAYRYYSKKFFVSPEEYQKCITTNSIWTAQWYPNSPVGFNLLHASTYEALHAALTERARS